MDKVSIFPKDTKSRESQRSGKNIDLVLGDRRNSTMPYEKLTMLLRILPHPRNLHEPTMASNDVRIREALEDVMKQFEDVPRELMHKEMMRIAKPAKTPRASKEEEFVTDLKVVLLKHKPRSLAASKKAVILAYAVVAESINPKKTNSYQQFVSEMMPKVAAEHEDMSVPNRMRHIASLWHARGTSATDGSTGSLSTENKPAEPERSEEKAKPKPEQGKKKEKPEQREAKVKPVEKPEKSSDSGSSDTSGSTASGSSDATTSSEDTQSKKGKRKAEASPAKKPMAKKARK